MLSGMQRAQVYHGTWRRVWKPGPTPIVGNAALVAFLQAQGITPSQYDQILAFLELSPSQADDAVKTGTITQEQITFAYDELFSS